MSAATISDGELGRELMNGSFQAFERFVDIYHAKVFQYSFTMCGQREDAEEVAQETLMKVFESLAQLREPERLKAWVFRIAKNACLMKRRKSVFAPSAELSLDALTIERRADGEAMRLEIPDRLSLPDSRVRDAELRQALNRAIRELPEAYRAIVLLRDVEELSTADAASILGVSEDAVKTRLRRAHLALRKTLDGRLRTTNGVIHE